VSEEASLALWSEALLAAALLAIDPAGLKGAVLRAQAGPVREAWLAVMRKALPESAPWRRAPLGVEDERLLGGLDLAATLRAGRPVAGAGLLAEADGGCVLLPMAERLTAGAAGRIAAVLDQGAVRTERDGLALDRPARIAVLALDESLEEEPGPPPVLTTRLAFPLDLRAVSHRDAAGAIDPAEIAAARAVWARLPPASTEVLQALAGAALQLGVSSLPATLLALRAARAHAALEGKAAVDLEDAAAAARLVLAPRALVWPEAPEQTPEQTPEPPPQDGAAPEADQDTLRPPEDVVLEAVRAALPAEVMAAMAKAAAARGQAKQSGAGAAKRSLARGRPVGVRSGALQAGARLALVDTLRAAAPWQPLRRRVGERRIQVRPEDFRLRRFMRREGSTTIFLVDASGSAAFQRLAEAKGAVELLLAKAYATRAEAALIAFRDSRADLALAPTRSLARARKRLADLPGGGGTPLAAALEAGAALALAERKKGRTPFLVLLSDGRANIDRSGAPGREQAQTDAVDAAKRLKALDLACAFLDTAPRPRPENRDLAAAMGATYAALPYLEAGAVLDAVRSAGAGR